MRLFAAIGIPKTALPSIARVSALLALSGARILPCENLHLTIKFIGETRENDLSGIGTALAGVHFRQFGVTISGAGAFPNDKFPRAIWLGGKSEGAGELAAKVDDALSFLHLNREKFTLHLTVARSDGNANIGDFLQRTGEVCSFEVSSFLLMESTLSRTGAKYRTIREFPAEEQDG